ncbi:MAG: hypothetical protein KKF48_03980 [Nanoarchaeota archaeon]|nr:hypothetical protein [Nanoarchaeota archaeon]MBU1028177.1 hypothetical protein [Nanoarchaeota archaeon]
MKPPKIKKGIIPNFIGTWSLGQLDFAEGLFYMYIENKEKVEKILKDFI